MAHFHHDGTKTFSNDEAMSDSYGLYRPVVANAADLGAMAACKHGEAQWYRATLERRGFAAVDAVVRAAARGGNLVPLTAYPEPPPWVAAIDVLDSNGDIVQNYSVSTDAALAWWMTATEMRLTQTDCRICDPIF